MGLLTHAHTSVLQGPIDTFPPTQAPLAFRLFQKDLWSLPHYNVLFIQQTPVGACPRPGTQDTQAGGEEGTAAGTGGIQQRGVLEEAVSEGSWGRAGQQVSSGMTCGHSQGDRGKKGLWQCKPGDKRGVGDTGGGVVPSHMCRTPRKGGLSEVELRGCSTAASALSLAPLPSEAGMGVGTDGNPSPPSP